MGGMPLWKIKRELVRLKVQAQAIPLALIEPLRQRIYDRTRPNRLTVTEGAAVPAAHVAIFLIYQPGDLPASVLATVQHLRANGFAPVIVSNGPLTANARAELARDSLLVMERPNFGYDFGGYRDGVWLLGELGIAPEKLLFLNDSVWFPVHENCRFLEDMTATEGDYIGTQMAGDPALCGRRRGFFTSYCFLVARPLLDSAAFRNFWRDYRLSSNKEVTLRRGERAFSHLMLDHARKAVALYDLARFDRLVAGLDEASLRATVQELVTTDPALEKWRGALVAKGAAARRDEILALIDEATRTKNYIGAAPVLCLRQLGFPMIKKNRERLYTLARRVILDAADSGRLNGLHDAMVAELRQKVAKDDLQP
jgi:hypothetical protein